MIHLCKKSQKYENLSKIIFQGKENLIVILANEYCTTIFLGEWNTTTMNHLGLMLDGIRIRICKNFKFLSRSANNIQETRPIFFIVQFYFLNDQLFEMMIGIILWLGLAVLTVLSDADSFVWCWYIFLSTGNFTFQYIQPNNFKTWLLSWNTQNFYSIVYKKHNSLTNSMI
jgi:hypothetical protein